MNISSIKFYAKLDRSVLFPQKKIIAKFLRCRCQDDQCDGQDPRNLADYILQKAIGFTLMPCQDYMYVSLTDGAYFLKCAPQIAILTFLIPASYYS